LYLDDRNYVFLPKNQEVFIPLLAQVPYCDVPMRAIMSDVKETIFNVAV